MEHWQRRRNTGVVFSRFAAVVAALAGVPVVDVYPSSRRGPKAKSEAWISRLVDCYIACLHFEGHAQTDIAKAVALGGNSKKAHVNRAVNEWRNVFPKRTRLDYTEDEEGWFLDHLQTVHGEEALSRYRARKRDGFETRPYAVMRMHPTSVKAIRVEEDDVSGSCRRYVWRDFQDYDPDPAYEFTLRIKRNRFGSHTPNGGSGAGCTVQGARGSSTAFPALPQSTRGEDEVTLLERLDRIEEKLDLGISIAQENAERLRAFFPSDEEEVTKVIDAFIESATA
jgi:hypothetical protein